MVKIKKEILLLFLILALALVLRLWGIDFGLPYQFHQDEPIVVNHALAYGSGDLNPHFFKIPPLTSYILFFIYGFYFLTGRLLGLFSTPEGFALAFFKDPSPFYILGRSFIGLIPGLLSIILTYALYKRLFTSEKAAVFAAAAVSFSFSEVLSSHYIYTDMLMLVFIILSLIQLARMLNEPRLKNYILSGLSLGLTCGIKYNAAVLAIPFLIAHFIILRNKTAKTTGTNLLLGIAASAAAFFLVNPFALINFRFFVKELLIQGGAESYSGWRHHIFYSLSEGAGLPLLILGVLGLILIFIKDRRKGVFLISFPLIFYLHLVFFSQSFPRYAIPLIPFLATGAGFFVFEYLFPKMKRGLAKATVMGLVFFMFVSMIAKSVKADLLFASQDTRIEAARWIADSIGPQAKIAVDHTFFRPAIIQNREQLMDKYRIIDRQKGLKGLKDKKLHLMLEAQGEKRSYYIYFLNAEPGAQGQFLSTMPTLPFDYQLLKEKGIQYVVINYADRQKGVEDFYRDLKDDAKLVTSFSPYQDGQIRLSYDRIATTCMPYSCRELYSRVKSGPALEIYRIKTAGATPNREHKAKQKE